MVFKQWDLWHPGEVPLAPRSDWSITSGLGNGASGSDFSLVDWPFKAIALRLNAVLHMGHLSQTDNA
jgi:hypothetical protein